MSDINKNQKEETPSKGRFKSELFEWGEALVAALTLVIIIYVFVVKLIGVDGSSMYPTLHDKDQIVVSNLFYTPEKGDIVVLTKESFLKAPIVKRIIATEGDTIDVDYETGDVTVNGEVLDEEYINERVSFANVGDMEFPQTVPEGCIFVMGDNRNASSDSRVSSLGMVDERYIIGKVLFRVFPFDRFGAID